MTKFSTFSGFSKSSKMTKFSTFWPFFQNPPKWLKNGVFEDFQKWPKKTKKGSKMVLFTKISKMRLFTDPKRCQNPQKPTTNPSFIFRFLRLKSLDGPPKVHFLGSNLKNLKIKEGLGVVFSEPISKKGQVQNWHYPLRKNTRGGYRLFSQILDPIFTFSPIIGKTLCFWKIDI